MQYTTNDQENIQNALNEDDPWRAECIQYLKPLIKEHFRTNQGEHCCYCRRDTTGEFSLVLDIEHILPKSIFKIHTFNLTNLSVACKRCNMNIKGTKTDFILTQPIQHATTTNSSHYAFIHPNLDIYSEHLARYCVSANDVGITIYHPKSTKGEFTYDFFKLSKLEKNDLDKAQGIEGPELQSSNHTEPIIDKMLELAELLRSPPNP
jgi:hypothetical protein